MDDRNSRRLVQLILIGFLLQLMVICYIFYQSYQGRVDIVHSQRAGCERGKLDRNANARSWRKAERARLNTVAEDLHISYAKAEKLITTKPSVSDSFDLQAAREYDKTATGQEQRSRISCTKAFPKAGFLP